MKNFRLILIIFLLVSACTNLDEAKKVLKNEKASSTDEFLVKKKEPLTLPPDFDKLPLPNSISENKDNSLSNEEKIKKILTSEEENLSESGNSSNLEETIIKQIR
tara:strand:- start:260 stop:574 length:315 start_codon:yes stop_codon:yes gene_type:complete